MKVAFTLGIGQSRTMNRDGLWQLTIEVVDATSSHPN